MPAAEGITSRSRNVGGGKVSVRAPSRVLPKAMRAVNEVAVRRVRCAAA